MPSNLPKINMFWHGGKLGPVHSACMRSFLRHGHKVVLHCYEAPADLPAGVETFDAEQIMPRSDLVANKATGSVALGANRYRYRLMRHGMGVYADCDMFCLQPIPDADYIFGWEDARKINNAILKYPRDSALADMLEEKTKTEYYIPDNSSRRRKYLLRIRHAFGLGVSVRHMRWGVWGPQLLTDQIRTLKLENKAQPIDRFYPLHYFNTSLLFEKGLRIEDLVTRRTLTIHLSNKMLDKRPPPANSPLDQIINS